MQTTVTRMIIVIVIFLAAATVWNWATPPPDRESDTIEVAAAMPTDRVRELTLGDFTAIFETTTLGEIRAAAKAGQIERAGDAGTAEEWLCYSLSDQLIWLVSGPLGGPNACLTEVITESLDPSDPRNGSCEALPPSLRPVSLEFGWIGSDEKSIHHELGKPSGVRGEWQFFHFAGKSSNTKPGDPAVIVEYDVVAYVEARIKNGRVVAVRASHVTTY